MRICMGLLWSWRPFFRKYVFRNFQRASMTAIGFILWHISSYNFFFLISKWADDSNWFEVVPQFVVPFYLILFTLLLCEPGSKMTKQFDIFGDKLAQCNWYAVPAKLQRMYLIFFSDTQNPIKISSYGNIVCERETSKTVCQLWVRQIVHIFCNILPFICRFSTKHFRTLWCFASSNHRVQPNRERLALFK